jgi:methylmalonyl-CoA mutase N-terminal domain/subunit
VIFRVNTELARSQIERVQRVRSQRDSGAAEAAVKRLGDSAKGDENLMPAILDCVRAYATIGEICGELRRVWGDYRPPTVV